MFINTNKSLKTLEPAGDGDTIIAFLPFNAFMILFIGVAAGLVDGVTAATTPTGFAISIIPFSLSSLITPTVFIFLRSLNNPRVFLLFFNILSFEFPRPVSLTAKSDIFLLFDGLHNDHATAVITSSTFF